MLVKGLLLATLSYRVTAGPASGKGCTSITEVKCYQEILANKFYGVGTAYEGYAKACFFMKTPESKRFARCVYGLPDEGLREFWDCRNSIVDDLKKELEKEYKKASGSDGKDGKKSKDGKKKDKKGKGRAGGSDRNAGKPQCLLDLEQSDQYHQSRVAKSCIKCLAKKRTTSSESNFDKCVMKAQRKGNIDDLIPFVYDCFHTVSSTQSCDNFVALIKTVVEQQD